MTNISRLTRIRRASLIALVSLLAGCHRGAGEKPAESTGETRPVRVTPVRPERKTLVRTVDLPGRTEAYETTPLYAKIAGYVKTIHVDIGDVIQGPRDTEPGKLLCELEIPDLREEFQEKTAMVRQAQAEILQSDAAIKVAEAAWKSTFARLREAKAAVAKAEAQFTRWQSEFDRVSKLAASGAVSKKVADEAQAELEAADAGRNEAAARVASADAARKESAAQLEKAKSDAVATRSRLAVFQAEQRRLQALLNYSYMRAPYDGVVVERNVHTGHLIQAGSDNQKPPLVVMRVDPIRVVIDVPESEAVYITQNSGVELRIPSLSGEPHVGQITRMSWALNATSRTLAVEIDVPNPDGRWRPGQFVNAKITVAERPDAIALPRTAIMTHDKQTCCFVIGSDGRLIRRTVSLGIQAGNEFEIRSGLTGKEHVIAVNTNAFREGQTVEIAQSAK